jgi:hypothetical protein
MGAVHLLPQVIGQQIDPRMAFGWVVRGDPPELRGLVAQGYGNVFDVIGLQRWYLALIVAATVTNVVVSVALVRPLGL